MNDESRHRGRGLKRRCAFTLIELLVVIAIIGILVGLLLQGMSAMRDAARRKKAATVVQALVNASKAYRLEYGEWPGQMTGTSGDRNPADFKAIMNAFTNNPRNIDYFEIPAGVTYDSTNGVLVDPWQHGFVIALDDNMDDVTDVKATAYTPNVIEAVKDGVAAMSWGPNPGNVTKRIYSWKK